MSQRLFLGLIEIYLWLKFYKFDTKQDFYESFKFSNHLSMLTPNSIWIYIILLAILNFGLSYVFTWLSMGFAIRYGILDHPHKNLDRKKHLEPIPLMGATGFILSSSFLTGFTWLIAKNMQVYVLPEKLAQLVTINLTEPLLVNLETFRIYWIYLSGLILFVAGYLDDKYQFKSKIMILPVMVAILVTIFFGGLSIDDLSYPFNQVIPDNHFLHYFLAFVWLGLCVSATKFLDGLDGLVSSFGIIALLAIATISGFDYINQPMIMVVSLIWVFGLAGFLPWNLPQAKVYLGEGGSLLIGFVIGVLSIISGAKVATSLSVIGWFVYDIIFVMLLRIMAKQNPLEGDRRHWHFRLQDLGLKKFQVLGITNLIVSFTAILGIFLPTVYKVYVLIGQGVILLGLFSITEWVKRGRGLGS